MLTLAEARTLLPGARLVGDGTLVFTRVHSDTRSLQAGDLFGLELFDERGDCRTNAVTLSSVRLLALQEDDLLQAVQDTPLLYAPLRQIMRGFTLGLRVHLPWREDVVTAGSERERVLANAPAARDGFFTVPKVVE